MSATRPLFSLFLVCLGLLFTANSVWALGFEINQSKEELDLQYQISVDDHGTGRVTAHLIIADTGKLKRLSSIDLFIASQDGTPRPDLSVSLETKTIDGKIHVRAHLKRELAKRAHFQLITGTNPRTGKQEPLSWYYFPISISKLLTDKK